MAVLQTLAEQALGWLVIAVSLVVPGVVATICWSPFLASERIRSLFKHVPPFESMVLTYVVVGIVASLPYILGITAVIASLGVDEIWGPPILGATMVLTLCYCIGIPLFGVLGLPRLGIDWDPTGYGRSTWLLLIAGGIWYAGIFALPLTVLGLILSLPGGW
ncbi:hypothetical protein ACFQGT_01745 [Natrialbaceae archaeon GCM10025810]|uniref:hypothetical protein n=1 Tax=Halovalidus salilacus TaxID=3075124 RepID=UPI003609258E